MTEQRRYIASAGLAFSEHREMKKLERLAAQGWFLDSFTFTGYRVRRGEPQQLSYCVDYNHAAIQDMDNYVEMFEAGGWTKVCSTERIHIFSAPKGTRRIYSDSDTVVEKYRSAVKLIKPYLVIPLVTLLLFALFAMVNQTGGGKVLESFLLVTGSLDLVLSVPIAMTYAMFVFRLNRVNKRG